MNALSGEPHSSFLHERAARLSRLTAHAAHDGRAIAHDFPLLKVLRLPPAALALLQDAARQYLWENLVAWHGHGAVSYGPTILEDHAEQILALPNRTPNGLIQPKRPAMASFNMLHRVLAAALRQIGLTPQFSAIQLPVNVRVVGGAAQPGADKRPYSSAKIHTDAWNSEPLSALLFNIPLLGDPAQVGIRYYAFRDPQLHMFGPLDDYSDMPLVENDLIPYEAPFELGMLYLSDQTSLHQTVRKDESAIRLSLDFRGVVRELITHESYDVSQSGAHYSAVDVWDQVGCETALTSDQPIDAFQRRQRGEALQEPAAASLNVDGLISS